MKLHLARTRLLQALHLLHPVKKPHAHDIGTSELRGLWAVFLQQDTGLRRSGRIVGVSGFKVIAPHWADRAGYRSLIPRAAVQSGKDSMQVEVQLHREALSRSSIS